jgi:nicotinamide phosphoribosyltransferase
MRIFNIENKLFDIDSYKPSHYLQYPPKTEKIFSYIESRGGEYPATVFFGLQYILSYLSGRFCTSADVEEAKIFFELHGEPFNYDDWMYIARDLHGYLPVRIRAVEEGSVVPVGNILVSVENTDPRCYWLTSWIETLLMRVWYPITVSTQSYYIRQTIYSYLKQTCETPDAEIDFKLHDFGARGVSSKESSGIGGMAHLVNFRGSDTVMGIIYANNYYSEEMAGHSIPAAEHSSITSWGRDREVDAYRNMLKMFADRGLFAVVSDSYDIYNAISKLWGEELKDEVLASGARVVIRPDSGVPHEVVLKCVELLGEKYGYTTNALGYRVLHPSVRVIQGDGICHESIIEILDNLVGNGWSAENVTFGMGGALLQKVDRDTQKFAMKASWGRINNEPVDIYKDPVTDSVKKSKKGLLTLVKIDGQYQTVDRQHMSVPPPAESSELETVFYNGDVTRHQTFADIRARVQQAQENKEVVA